MGLFSPGPPFLLPDLLLQLVLIIRIVFGEMWGIRYLIEALRHCGSGTVALGGSLWLPMGLLGLHGGSLGP